MGVNKHQAVIDYIITCPTILNSPLYFNFINAKNDTNQFFTNSTDSYTNRSYVDGSVEKIYTFTILTFKSAADTAVVKMSGYENENLSDMSDVQNLIEWITEQNRLRNFPDFGEDCIIDSIETTTEEPKFDGIDDQVSPPLAVYSTSIQIKYIDISDKIWR